MGFELIDELAGAGGIPNDLAPHYAPPPSNWNQILADWHRTMYGFIKSIDPNQHLISSAVPDPDLGVLINPVMDFQNIHWYTDYGSSRENGLHQPFEYSIADWVREWNAIYKKPIGIMETYWCAAHLCEDPHAHELHNLIWPALFNGSMGLTAIWAHEVEVLGSGALYQFAGVGAFSRLLPLLNEHYVPFSTQAHRLKWEFLVNNLEDALYGRVQDENFTYFSLWYGPHGEYLFHLEQPGPTSPQLKRGYRDLPCGQGGHVPRHMVQYHHGCAPCCARDGVHG